MESPFLSGKEPSFEDLIIALRVCSTKSWVNLSKISLIDKIKISRIKYDLVYQINAFKDFQTYFSESASAPKLWSSSSDGNISVTNNEKIPNTIVMVILMMAKLGFTEDEAWNMPLGKVAWYSTAFSFIEGGDISTISTEIEESAERESDKLKKFQEEQIRIARSKHRKVIVK